MCFEKYIWALIGPVKTHKVTEIKGPMGNKNVTFKNLNDPVICNELVGLQGGLNARQAV